MFNEQWNCIERVHSFLKDKIKIENKLEHRYLQLYTREENLWLFGIRHTLYQVHAQS